MDSASLVNALKFYGLSLGLPMLGGMAGHLGGSKLSSMFTRSIHDASGVGDIFADKINHAAGQVGSGLGMIGGSIPGLHEYGLKGMLSFTACAGEARHDQHRRHAAQGHADR
jgi:hypothetical protein